MNGAAIPFVVLSAMYEVMYSYLSAGCCGGTNLVLMFYSEVVVVVLKLLTLLIINASTILVVCKWHNSVCKQCYLLALCSFECLFAEKSEWTCHAV